MTVDLSCDAAQSKLEDFLREQAISSGQSLCLEQGNILFEAQDASDALYLIKKGRIKVFIRNPAGDQIELAVLHQGALIGEMSLFGEATRSASCSALDPDTELLAIPRSLVADGNYTGVHALINSLGNPDPAVRSAREAFRLMLSRVQEREAKLQSAVATLSLEIDRQRASQEVASVMESSLFQNLQRNASDLRKKLRE